MEKYIRTLTIFYDTEISYGEIPLFRGAVLKSLGDKAHVLYHNHTGDDTFRYSYPLVQYKRLNGKAAMVCIEEGADILGQFLSESGGKLKIGERTVQCNVSKIKPVRLLVQIWNNSFHYHINRWLPLNAKNYRIYQMTDDAEERKALLEGILKANLLSMLKGFDIHLETELFLKITQLSNSYIVYNKGIALMAFNADFDCNLSIPDNLGIGKNASIGCGVVRRQNKEIEKNQDDGNI